MIRLEVGVVSCLGVTSGEAGHAEQIPGGFFDEGPPAWLAILIALVYFAVFIFGSVAAVRLEYARQEKGDADGRVAAVPKSLVFSRYVGLVLFPGGNLPRVLGAPESLSWKVSIVAGAVGSVIVIFTAVWERRLVAERQERDQSDSSR